MGKRDSSPAPYSRCATAPGGRGSWCWWAAASSQLPFVSLARVHSLPEGVCLAKGETEVRVPSSFASLSQTHLEEPRKVYLQEIPRCWWLWLGVLGSPSQALDSFGQGKHGDSSLLTFCSIPSWWHAGRAGRHSEQSPGPDYMLAMASWGRRCWQWDEGGRIAAPSVAAEGDCSL